MTSKAAHQALWTQGWYRFASVIASPNCDKRPPQQAIELLVIHSISLPPGEYGGEQVAQFFTNSLDHAAHPYYEPLKGVTVSAHFFVRRDGRLLQFVSADQRAWHAGASSFKGHERCNDFSIGIELEGLEDEPFEAAQYDSLCALTQALCERYPLKAAASHQHIAPARKRDPGVCFEWSQLARAAPRLEIFP